MTLTAAELIEIDHKRKQRTEALAKQQDVVNHPQHYNNGKIECIDAIESAVTGLKGMDAVCTGHIMRYIWRWPFKNGLEDLKKCRFYLDKLIAKVEAETGQAVPKDCRQCKFFSENNSYGLWQCQITKKPFNADSSIPACEMFTNKNEKGDK